MDGHGTRPPLTDAQLDRELESALGIEPSPAFIARVRTRIATEPPASSWRVVWSRWAAEPLIVVAIVGVTLAIVVPRAMRDRPVTPQVATAIPVPGPPAKRPTQDPGYGYEASRREDVSNKRARTVRRVQNRQIAARATDVLVSEDERRAFDALLAAVAQNRLPVRVLSEGEQESFALPPIQIQQLTIEPVQLTRLD